MKNVTIKTEETSDMIRLEYILVAPTARRRGLGSQAMQELIDYADAKGKTVRLTPDGSFGTPVSALRDFYAGFGFVDRGMPSGAMQRDPLRTMADQCETCEGSGIVDGCDCAACDGTGILTGIDDGCEVEIL